MILDGEDGQLLVAESLHRAVVQVDMGNLQPTLEAVGVGSVAVVLSRDMDSPISQVSDRVVATPVPELQLEGFSAKGSSD